MPAMLNKDDVQAVCNMFELRYGLPENMLFNMAGVASNYGAIMPTAQTVGLFAQSLSFQNFVQNTFGFTYDRNDPLQSTQAAAMFLHWAFHRFGAWDLALAAYNWNWTAVAGYVRGKALGMVAQMPIATVNFIKAVGPSYYRG